MSDVDPQDMPERRDGCTYIVSEYEAGNLLRHHANSQILDQFLSLENADRIEAAITPFRQALDDIDAARAARKTRSPARSIREDRQRVLSKRARSNGSAGSGSDREGGDSGEEAKRKQWPWEGKAKINDPELAKTLSLRAKYREQLEKAKDSIVTSVGAPTFPEPLWTNILKHGYIDFDKLNGAHFSAVNEEEGSAAIVGEYTIRLKSKLATKPVTTSTDWLYCYEAYERAVIWAYPHRAAELHSYYTQFHGLFRSYATSAHIRLINLDRAIRNEVASGSLLKLTDPAVFARLREQYLSVDGAGYQANSGTGIRAAGSGSSGGAATRVRTKIQEPCLQWNDNRCSRPDGVCIYTHKCIGCGGGHPQAKCPQTKSGGGGRVATRD